MREVCRTSVYAFRVAAPRHYESVPSPYHTTHHILLLFFYQNLLSFSWRDLHSIVVVDFFSPFISFLSLFNKDSFLGGKADSVVFFWTTTTQGRHAKQKCFLEIGRTPLSQILFADITKKNIWIMIMERRPFHATTPARLFTSKFSRLYNLCHVIKWDRYLMRGETKYPFLDVKGLEASQHWMIEI